jgi:hypothetical protein
MNASPTIQIDKYIAIPAPKRRLAAYKRPEKYPYSHMQPGDSFFVPGGRVSASDKRVGLTLNVTIHHVRKRFPGTKWTVRAVTENGINGVRVWRVS